MSSALTSNLPAESPESESSPVAQYRAHGPQEDRQLVRSIFALSVGAFAIGTGEFVIMGLLPEVARDLDITIPQAGHVISAYAMGVMVGAPSLALLTAKWERRKLLMLLMVVFALGNLASACAPGYFSANVLRFVAGLPHGAYFGVASVVLAGLAEPTQRARAIGLMMIGLAVGTMLGVPFATALGQWLSWRAAFVFVGLSGVVALAMVWKLVPRVQVDPHASARRELGALRRPQVWLTLGIGGIGFGGMFAVFSYVKPTLLEVAKMPMEWMPVVLGLFGLGMIVGNLVGARLADRNLMRTIGGLLLWSAFVLSLYVITSHHAIAAVITVFLVGTEVAIGPGLQIRLMDVAGDAQTMASALNQSAFNMANAVGAWLGGVAISAGLGYPSTGWVGSLLALAGLVMFGWSRSWDRHFPSRPVMDPTQHGHRC
jgi:MFS transporter, DHA1 family, inner membrane transport protein